MVVDVCSELLGRLHSLSGGRLGAYAELSAAVDLLRTMEMRRWLPEAEAALTLSRI